MKRRLALITLFFVSALAVFGQSKPLVVANTIPTTIKFEGYANFALPTFCDESGRSYVKLMQPGKGIFGPLFRVSDKGVAEAEFDITGTLGNTFAVRPNGGIVAAHLEGKTKVIDNFGPDGTRDAEVRLEQPPIPFFPMQIAIFPSGGILLAGAKYQRGDEASTAVYGPEGQLIQQIVLEGDASRSDRSSISRSVAVTGDDGNVYLMRAASPPTVYAISSKGEVLRKIVVQSPTGVGSPDVGIRVIKNRLVVQFHRECTNKTKIGSCKGTVFSILDATTGKVLANYALEESAGAVLACYAPDPDRFFMLNDGPYGTAIEIVESAAK